MTTRTEERILRTFLRLLTERGLEGTTTRGLAEEAGVNEVTLFRLFGDKGNLAAKAFRQFPRGAVRQLSRRHRHHER